jgi:uncharacterized phage protein (TIGR01671 family)
MREIKFKFWSKILNRFVIPDDDIFVGALKDENMVPLQYTGLKDKNRKEIYEGDIITVKDDGFGYKYIGVINWEQDALSYLLGIIKDYPTMSGGKREIPRTLRYHSFEVIGNIWENPELLK